jgi:hypothetical protein
MGKAMTDRPPAWVDMATLCRETCLSETTVKSWVQTGDLPEPVKRRGKLMWKWATVDAYLEHGPPDVAGSPKPGEITDNVKRILAGAGHG